MALAKKRARNRVYCIAALCLSWSAGTWAVFSPSQSPAEQPSAQTTASMRPMGTIKSISGNTIVLTTDAGNEVIVLVQDATRLVRIAPGQKDLKDAVPIQLPELQPGDRILVRGKLTDDGKSVQASSVIAMKKSDLAEKQSRERDEWQKHGVGGLVSSVDPAGNTIKLALPSIGEKKNVSIHFSKDTILRRYAPDSVKFDDAKPAPLDQVKPGDQLRARGVRSADGSELTADEIVSGSFRNIAGTISSIDPAASTITVQDLFSKRALTLKVTADSQLRKLLPPMAQRIAMRLKGIPADSQAPGPGPPASASSNVNSKQTPTSASPQPGGFGAMGRPGGGGSPDLQQAINRMPPASLADLQKADAVMIVATESGPNGLPMVITLLAGVEPILEAAPQSNASTILSPWSLSSAPGGEAAAP